MSYSIKSIVLDIADNWGNSSILQSRSFEFKLNSVLQSIGDSDISATYGTQYSAVYEVSNLFNTGLSKIGNPSNTEWVSAIGSNSNQRLICVFVTPILCDEIVINNNHESGTNTDRGIKNVKIIISSDTITDTTYNVEVSNSTIIFNGFFNEHIASNIIDDQVLELISQEKECSGINAIFFGFNF